MSPNKDASSLNSSAAGLVCLPPVSEELQLVWTQAIQTSELDGNEHLLQAFSYFPYPSLADIALLCLRHGLQMEKVKTWFMAQRLRCGISWSSEEIEETRARVVYHRDQLLFKSLLSFTQQSVRPPQERPPVLRPEQVALGLSPLAPSEQPTHMKGLKVEPEEPSQVSQLPLNHQNAKEPLMMGSRTFSHQSDCQDLQISGLSKEQAGRGPDQSCGKTASWNHFTAVHQPDMQHQRKTKRKTKEQLAILKSFFLQCQWARREDYHKLEQITGLPRPEIIQWFGDTRYALKHGQLKWFRDNAVLGTPSFQDPAIPTPSTRSLKEWAKTPPLPAPPPPPDIRPLEAGMSRHSDCDYYTWQVEAGGSRGSRSALTTYEVKGQPGLCETLF